MYNISANNLFLNYTWNFKKQSKLLNYTILYKILINLKSKVWVTLCSKCKN